MPVKKKEPKIEEPVFVDEQGSFVHEKELAKYTGGIRKYINPSTLDGATGGSGKGGGKNSNAAAKRNKEERDEAAAAAGGTAGPWLAIYRHGRGTYSSPLLHYEGNWVEDVMEGEGCLRFLQTGSSYTGQLRQGRFEGKGLYTWADGSQYDGQWRGSRMHGEGVFTDAEGNVWKGAYFNGTGPGLERVYHNAAVAAAALPVS